MLKKILISLIISFVVFCLQAYLSFQFLLWLNPPYVIVDGQIRYTMPLGPAILSFIIGAIGALVTFVLCFRKVKKQK
ncbi:hypothetical protein [Capnocytophaga stomatis]|uniref:Lipopolysaccharide assembly protein A domain-containing protein n=1 Tax=Capnocytophaga stomatis TaxID=1848904 RepID=A0ABW8QAK1_9FLAO